MDAVDVVIQSTSCSVPGSGKREGSSTDLVRHGSTNQRRSSGPLVLRSIRVMQESFGGLLLKLFLVVGVVEPVLEAYVALYPTYTPQ